MTWQTHPKEYDMVITPRWSMTWRSHPNGVWHSNHTRECVCQVKKVKKRQGSQVHLSDFMMCIYICIDFILLWTYCYYYEAVPLIVKCVNKINLLLKESFEHYKMDSIVDMVWSLFLKLIEVVGDDDDDTICVNLGYPSENL